MNTADCGTGHVSFCAALRRRLQRAEKGEYLALISEALDEQDAVPRAHYTQHHVMHTAGESALTEGDPDAADERKFERCIALSESHNSRRALAVLDGCPRIPRDEATRQHMKAKACMDTPAAEKTATMQKAEHLVATVAFKPASLREIKLALGRLAGEPILRE